MTPDERREFERELVRIVRYLQRNYERVYPWMIQAHLDIRRHPATLRKDCVRLAKRGDLIRVGGWDARRGYLAA
jgi:hypothetical protein